MNSLTESKIATKVHYPAQPQTPPPGDRPDPQPLPPGLPPVLAFDLDWLPKTLRGWVLDIAERMQCPSDYIAATVAVVAGSLIGRKLGIRPKRQDDWTVVPNLFGMLVGRPSLMKSPAMQEVLTFLNTLEVKAKQDYDAALAEWGADAVLAEVERSVTKTKLKAAIKKGDDAARELAEQMQQAETTKPVRRRYVSNDATVEKIGMILADNPNGFLLFIDELIRLLKTMDREGHEADRGFYLTAWAGNSRYTYDRVGRGTLDVEAAIVSIIGSIQPGVIADYLRSAVAGGTGDDGLMQRFQLAVWPDAPKHWRNVDRYPDADAKRCAYEALQRVNDLTPDDVCAERDTLNAHAIPFLRLEADAQQRMDNWRCGLETRLRAGELHPALESHLAKYRSLVPSLALILHLLEGDSGPVTDEAVAKAVHWGTYLESHAQRLYAGVTQGPAVSARLLAERIVKGEVPDPFSARDVYRNHWTGLDRQGVADAVDMLVSLNWLFELEQLTPGRPKASYRIHEKIARTPRNEVTKVPKDSYDTSGTSSAEEGGEKFDIQQKADHAA